MDDEQHICDFCGASTHEDTVRLCLWEGGRLVVIENVPARVCDKCLEQFYDGLTMFKIDQLRGRGFPNAEAVRMLEVPVFALPVTERLVEAEPAVEPVAVDRRGEVYDWWADV